MAESLTYVEIDVPYCSLDFGVSPCTATGTKCFNTLQTCKDRPNFTDVPETLRFVQPTDYLPQQIEAIPSLRTVTISPSVVSLGHDLGERAQVSAVFEDHPWTDTGPGGDKYISERPYNPYDQGSYWGKFRARHPFLRGRKMRVIRGKVGDTISAMTTRHYRVDSIDGPSMDGRFVLRASDPLKFADGPRAMAPMASHGYLASSISATATQLTLSPSGIGNSEYPNTGHLNIGGEEVVRLTGRNGDVCAIVRGAYNTTGVEHAAEDRAQICLRFNDTGPQAIIAALLQGFAGVTSAEIPISDWTREVGAYAIHLSYGALITEPTSVRLLVSEMIEQAGLFLWWDDITEKVNLRVLRPIPDPNCITEDQIIKGTLTVMERPSERISQVWVYYARFNPLLPVGDTDNYVSISATVNLQAESDYGSPSIKVITSRWIPNIVRRHGRPDGGLGREVAESLSQIYLARFAGSPRRFRFSLIRDDNITLLLGAGYRLESHIFQDASGASVSVPVQITSLLSSDTRQEVEAEEVLYREAVVLAPFLLNGGFDDSAGWILAPGWSIGGGVASKTPGNSNGILQDINTLVGVVYRCTFTILNHVSGELRSGLSHGGGEVNGLPRITNGTYVDDLVAIDKHIRFRISATSGTRADIDNVSCERIA